MLLNVTLKAPQLWTPSIGTQLSIFGMLWMLRRSYNVDVFISKSCHQTLSRVFTQESLKEISVLEDYFCNHEDIGKPTFSFKISPLEGAHIKVS